MPPPTGNLSIDTALRATFLDRTRLRNMFGVVVQPADGLDNAMRACETGDVLILLPGEYDCYSTISVSKQITVLGIGATIVGEGVLLTVDADQAQIRNIGFRRKDRSASRGTSAAVIVNADAVLVDACTFETPGQCALQINGNYCSAQNNMFLASASHIAGDSDVYWSDGATYGTACGNIWSRTAGTFVIDYRWVDNLTESANGNAGIINIR
jgi:pectate lyase